MGLDLVHNSRRCSQNSDTVAPGALDAQRLLQRLHLTLSIRRLTNVTAPSRSPEHGGNSTATAAQQPNSSAVRSGSLADGKITLLQPVPAYGPETVCSVEHGPPLPTRLVHEQSSRSASQHVATNVP